MATYNGSFSNYSNENRAKKENIHKTARNKNYIQPVQSKKYFGRQPEDESCLISDEFKEIVKTLSLKDLKKLEIELFHKLVNGWNINLFQVHLNVIKRVKLYGKVI